MPNGSASDAIKSAECYRDLGDYRDARQQFERALEIGQATVGPDHPTMATFRRNLDHVLQQPGGE